jgi:rubrerythrin
MSNREAVLDIVRKAFQIEVDGYTFYSMTAAKAEKPMVQELFEKLASDEVQHQAFLKNVATRYDQEGLAAFKHGRPSDWSAISDRVFTGRFREQASGAQFELAVLSIGMTLEQNAITYFSSAAKSATENEVKEFYTFLAEWEQTHFDALQSLYNAVRADYWHEGGFSPF